MLSEGSCVSYLMIAQKEQPLATGKVANLTKFEVDQVRLTQSSTKVELVCACLMLKNEPPPLGEEGVHYRRFTAAVPGRRHN